MTQLTRFLLRHAIIGMGLGLGFTSLLLALNVAGLGDLMWRSSTGPLAAAILAFATGLTFGSVQMGFAVMLMDKDEDDSGGRRDPRIDAMALRPVPVLAPPTR